MPVETLKISDLVVTTDGTTKEIRWIGRTVFDRNSKTPWAEGVRPVRIAKDAIGAGLPQRDLFVSRGHLLYLNGVLIPAGDLVNGRTITIVHPHTDRLEYYHIELDRHDVLLAEGLPCESLLASAESRSTFCNAGEQSDVTARLPAAAMTLCAPLAAQNGGRSALRSRLRSALAPVIDIRHAADIARDDIEARAHTAGQHEPPLRLLARRAPTARPFRLHLGIEIRFRVGRYGVPWAWVGCCRRHMRESLSALEMSTHKGRGFVRAYVVLGRAGVALVAFAFALCAEAAEIRAVRGQVLVNEGTGYRVIEGAVRLKIGDAAMAAPQGLGSLSYDDGCTIDVSPGTIAWIGVRSPCAAGGDRDASQDPAPVLQPRVKFDPNWLRDGAALIDGRKPAAGP